METKDKLMRYPSAMFENIDDEAKYLNMNTHSYLIMITEHRKKPEGYVKQKDN